MILRTVFVLLSLFFSQTAVAQRAVENDTHVIHFNALNADFLSPAVAKQYDISRSSNRGLLNIAVQRKTETGAQAVPASVTARAINLNSQTKNFAMREIREGGAIYYIGDFSVRDQEQLKFIVDVVPEQGHRQTVTFSQQFYTN